jgi:hypothetical protein
VERLRIEGADIANAKKGHTIDLISDHLLRSADRLYRHIPRPCQ